MLRTDTVSPRTRMRQRRPTRSPRGVSLIEALVALMILSVGLLGQVKMQSYTVTSTRDAMYRSEASVLAHEIIGVIWSDAANRTAYQHRPGGAVCASSGSAATSTHAVNWMNEFTTLGNARYLPGATADQQQIIIDTSVTPAVVRVHLCWRSPQDASDRSFVAVSRLPV
jgi:type IV pilus assembly protein PilV